MIPSWRQEWTKHWQKSLDHKSFFFKLNEKKTQSAKEFCIKLKQKIDKYNVVKDTKDKLELLEFYTGFEGQEIKALDLNVSEDISPSHPMMLSDEQYLENFNKLPHFRFLINDDEVIKLLTHLCSGRSHKDNHVEFKDTISESQNERMQSKDNEEQDEDLLWLDYQAEIKDDEFYKTYEDIQANKTSYRRIDSLLDILNIRVGQYEGNKQESQHKESESARSK